jgi:hypothetical protein
MGVPLEQFMDRFTADERADIEVRAHTLIADEMSLRDLRKARGETQTQLARKLRKPQATVSRIERQSDHADIDPRSSRAGAGRARAHSGSVARRPLYLTGLADLAGVRRKEAETRATGVANQGSIANTSSKHVT